MGPDGMTLGGMTEMGPGGMTPDGITQIGPDGMTLDESEWDDPNGRAEYYPGIYPCQEKNVSFYLF